MTERKAITLSAGFWLVGLLALVLALYLVSVDSITAGANLAILGIVLEGIAGCLLIWYAP